jgi:hypothetical protein
MGSMPPSRRRLLWAGVIGGCLLVGAGGLIVLAGFFIDPQYADRFASRMIIAAGTVVTVPAYLLVQRCAKELRADRRSRQSRPVSPQASSESDASTTS